MRSPLVNFLFLPINIVQGLLIILLTMTCGILGLILLLFLPPKPVMYFIAHVVWSPIMVVICMFTLKVRGKENLLNDRAVIFVANHESQMDITVLLRAIPKGLFFVAKQELSKIPIMGQYMRAMGMIFVDRKNKEKASASMLRAVEVIKSGRNVISFPEGTRSKTGELMLFKRGSFVIAQEGNIPIIPVAIKGTRGMLPSGSFAMRPGRVVVTIGEPMYPADYAHLSADQFADAARTKVAEMLSI